MSEPKYSLRTFINPFGLRPSFLIPVFHKGGELFVQEVEGERIVGFHRLDDRASPDPDVRVQRRLRVTRSGPAIFAFIFRKGDPVYGTRDELSGILKKRLDELVHYPFAHLEVARFIGELDESRRAIVKVKNTLTLYSQDIAQEYAIIQLGSRESVQCAPQEGITGMAALKYVDSEGFVNFWDLHDEIENLIRTVGPVQVKVKLVRSLIGISPKLRNALKSFGLGAGRIGDVGRACPVDSGNLRRLKQVRNKTLIVEVRFFAEDGEVVIKPCDVPAIQKRYLKKDPKKRTKGRHQKDYFCNIEYEEGNHEHSDWD